MSQSSLALMRLSSGGSLVQNLSRSFPLFTSLMNTNIHEYRCSVSRHTRAVAVGCRSEIRDHSQSSNVHKSRSQLIFSVTHQHRCFMMFSSFILLLHYFSFASDSGCFSMIASVLHLIIIPLSGISESILMHINI